MTASVVYLFYLILSEIADATILSITNVTVISELLL
jgi:hypothetical protein